MKGVCFKAFIHLFYLFFFWFVSRYIFSGFTSRMLLKVWKHLKGMYSSVYVLLSKFMDLNINFLYFLSSQIWRNPCSFY